MHRRWLWLALAALVVLSPAAGAASSPYEIQLLSGSFTPPEGVSDTVKRQLAARAGELKAAGRDKVHVLVQLYGVPTEGEKSELVREGLELGAYLPHHAWIAAVPVAQLERVAARKGVRHLSLWDAGRKLHPRVALGQLEAKDPAWPGRVKLHVELHADVDLSHGQRLAAEVGATEVVPIEGLNALVFWVPAEAVARLAAEEDVLWIEEAPVPFVPHNDGARAHMQADLYLGAPYALDGSGVRLFVLDIGSVRATHTSFDPGTGSRVTVIDASPAANHATHVAGTAAGDGSGSAGGRGRGLATASPILSAGAPSTTDVEPRYILGRNTHGADLGTNSFGLPVASNLSCTLEGDYTSSGNLLDGIVRGTNPNVNGAVIMTWSAGNERGSGNPPGRCGGNYRTTPPPSCAKNPIHIGAVYSDGGAMTNFSSWGPCDDGKMKPLVSAPGCETGLVSGEAGIYSSACSAFANPAPPCTSDTFYTPSCGTSMSTPAVAGVVAQLIEDWRARGFGGPTARPLPALVKALLMHSARDQGQEGPDFIFGYGTVDARALIDLERAGNNTLGGTATTRWGTDSISQGQTDSFTLQVPAGTAELKVSLAWDDAPSPSASTGGLINNLNLELVAPDTTIARPWVLDPGSPHLPATTGVNNLDNQEQVRVTHPQAGTWTVRVVGTTVPQGPQSYALVMSASPAPYNPATCSSQSWGFETGTDGWTLNPGAQHAATPAAGHGAMALRFGGTPGTFHSAFRDVAVPAWASRADWSFYWYMQTAEVQATGWNWDYFLAEVRNPANNAILAVLDMRFDGWQANQWLHQARLDLSAFRGQTVRLMFRGVNNPQRATTFWVDDTGLTFCERADVWARDRLADTGLEPDPATAGQPMWTSPDIWVRNQDDGIPQHENPEAGQVNYVHVEVRNRSTVTAASVPVAVYVANASVGLSWPGQWTLVGTTTVTDVPAGGSVVAKVPWKPRSTGHYCILARLLAPDDPMTFPETADITYNTRQNNNIVWHNVNVVDLVYDGRVVKAGLILRHPTNAPGPVVLEFRERPEHWHSHLFLDRGKLTVAIPPELAELWADSGRISSGVEWVDDLTFVVVKQGAHLGFTLPAKAEFPIRLFFEDTAEARGGVNKKVFFYDYDVVLHRDAGGGEIDTEVEPLGGVTYYVIALDSGQEEPL